MNRIVNEARRGADISAVNEKIKSESAFVDVLRNALSQSIIGQQVMIDRLILALLADGHILLEGMPGLAKTLAVQSLARAVDTKYQRIQFTPDLLPADLIGTMIYNQQQHEFTIRKGPIFSNFVLADEINRASAKVQSALLQAMQERQVTIGDQTYAMDPVFLVLATQNPIEQEGTYPLPEAQLDRFMLKVIITYPKQSEEKLILRQQTSESLTEISSVIKPEEILRARASVRQIYLDEKVEQYILDIVFATRFPEQYKLPKLKSMLQYGSSPRGTIYLALASKANAYMQHRGFVTPDDVREVCLDVLRHRIGITYEAEAESISSDDVIGEVLKAVPVP